MKNAEKLTKTGFRINKNGAIIDGIEKEAFTSFNYLGLSTKQNGTYYFYSRKQQGKHIYLPY